MFKHLNKQNYKKILPVLLKNFSGQIRVNVALSNLVFIVYDISVKQVWVPLGYIKVRLYEHLSSGKISQ